MNYLYFNNQIINADNIFSVQAFPDNASLTIKYSDGHVDNFIFDTKVICRNAMDNIKAYLKTGVKP